MYGAFLYQEDGDSYVTPFLIGIYDSIDEFKKIVPEIVKEHSCDRIDEFWGTRIVRRVHVCYPNESPNAGINRETKLLSLEELTPNKKHVYKYDNDMED